MNLKKRNIILFLFTFFSTVLCFAAPQVTANNVTTADQYLIDTIVAFVGIFDRKEWKVLCFVCLVGESFGIMWAGGNSNIPVVKKLIPIFVGTLLFTYATLITNLLFNINMNIIGDNKLPTFNKYLFPETKDERLAYSLINLPLVFAFNSFTGILSSIRNIVLSLIIAFCFLNIIFNAFKLWMGTIELKKVYIDIIYKFVLVLVLCAIYPTVQQKTLQLGTSIGMKISGGAEKLNYNFTDAYLTITKSFNKDTDELFKLIEKYGYVDEETGAVIFSKDFRQMEYFEKIDPDIIGTFAAENKILLVDEIKVSNGLVASAIGKTGYTDSNGEFHTIINKADIEYSYNGDKKKLKELTKSVNQEAKKLKALLDVVNGVEYTENDKLDETSLKDLSDGKYKKLITDNESIAKLWVNPYFISDNDNATFILAPATLLKMILVYTEIISDIQGNTLDGKKEKFSNVWNSIKSLIFKIIFIVFSYIASFYIIISYIMTVLEYLIVTSLAPLLIPFFFIDSIKSYAQNIIGLFIKYFFKFVISGLITFWGLATFMDTLKTGYENLNQTSFLTYIYYLFTMAIITTVVLFSEKYANALVSGNPSLGTGDLHHLAHDTGAAARTAGHAAKNVGKLGAGLVHGGANKTGTGIARYLGGKDTANDAKQERIKDLMNNDKTSTGSNGNKVTRKMTQKEATKQANKEFRGAGVASGLKSVFKGAAQDIGDAGHKALFGQEKQHRNEAGQTNGALSMGQKATDADNKQFTAGFSDVRQQARQGNRGAARQTDTEKHKTEPD